MSNHFKKSVYFSKELRSTYVVVDNLPSSKKTTR